MKLWQLITLVLLPALFVVSCKSAYKQSETVNENGQKQIHEWYSDGILKSTLTYLNADQTEYFYVSWYEGGALMDSARYINDKVEGLRKYYDEATGLLHLEEYSNGVMNGMHKAVYKNGATSFEGQRRNGLQIGEWIFHYPDGRPITYEYYDLDGKLLYFRKYNEEGKAIKSSGNPVLEIYHPELPISVGNPMKGTIDLVLPVNATASIQIIDSINNPAKPLLIENVISGSNNFIWTFNEPGKQKLWFIVNLKDEKSGVVETSRTAMEYSVEN
jgi:hypothetical protein